MIREDIILKTTSCIYMNGTGNRYPRKLKEKKDLSDSQPAITQQ